MFCFFKFDDGFCVFFWGDGGMGGCCFQPVKFNVFLACSVFCNVTCTGQNVFTVHIAVWLGHVPGSIITNTQYRY